MASSASHSESDTAMTADPPLAEAGLLCAYRMSQKQLAEQVGCSVRKLRTLIERGLIDKAHAAGRGAYYTDHHLSQALRALKALRRTDFTRNRLAYETSTAQADAYGQAASRVRAAARHIRRGVAASTLDLGCGIQAVVLKSQPPQIQVVQAAVLNAIAEVLARERVRMLEVCKALDSGTNASPFRL